MGNNFVTIAAGSTPGAPADTASSTVVIGMPVILIIIAFLLLASGKAPRLAGFCLFIAGVGLSGTAMAGSLSTSAHTIVAGTVDAITNSLK